MLFVEYMYSIVVPVKVASPVAMVQVRYILWCTPDALCHVNNTATTPQYVTYTYHMIILAVCFLYCCVVCVRRYLKKFPDKVITTTEST